jgi:fatty acid desaturase
MFFLFWLNGYNNSILQMNNVTFFLVISFLVYIFGYLKMLLMFDCIGFGYTFIANLSHIQHECIQINTENKNDFLYNQVSSSMNYRTDDPITRFICFGLDIQIEHHLFPNIPHSSLRQIQHIVRNYCNKNDIPYIEKPSIFPAIYSYISYLYKMGNP